MKHLVIGLVIGLSMGTAVTTFGTGHGDCATSSELKIAKIEIMTHLTKQHTALSKNHISIRKALIAERR